MVLRIAIIVVITVVLTSVVIIVVTNRRIHKRLHLVTHKYGRQVRAFLPITTKMTPKAGKKEQCSSGLGPPPSALDSSFSDSDFDVSEGELDIPIPVPGAGNLDSPVWYENVPQEPFPISGVTAPHVIELEEVIPPQGDAARSPLKRRVVEPGGPCSPKHARVTCFLTNSDNKHWTAMVMLLLAMLWWYFFVIAEW